MNKIKIFSNKSIFSLETDVNKWLSEQQDDSHSLLKFVLVDVKITTKSDAPLSNPMDVIAVVIYKKQ
jgi:hypothetical protein